ncbi:MAG: hypothetical protein ABIP94_11145 [Planctomycetota bacterium]
MNTCLFTFAAFLLLPAMGLAQNSFLFTTSLPEQTMSGSGGTVLKDLRPNEVAHVEFFPCPVISAEKWAPNTCYQTMAGNENSGPLYYNPALFGKIDALIDMPSPVAQSSQRTVFWSPSVAMGTSISGGPGLRPGDTGRIVQIGGLDGQVEYFLRAEDVQLALGMPITPIVVDVDAIAGDPGYGIFFSLDQDHFINNSCNVTFVRDGDVLLIPASAITWTWDFRVQSVVPGSAQVVYTEAQMDTFVQNASVNDHLGNCVNVIQDLEALEIDYPGPVSTVVPCPGNILTVPSLIFTGELMTGASVLTTANGGQIYQSGCGQLGRPCSSSPTLGDQMGLKVPTNGNGVPSFVNALANTWAQRFVIEPKQHVIPAFTATAIDIYTPGWINILAAKLVLPTIAPSIPWFPPYFPDIYVLPTTWTSVPFGGPGFTTVNTPIIPGTCKLVWQVAGFAPGLVFSTPAMLDVQ